MAWFSTTNLILTPEKGWNGNVLNVYFQAGNEYTGYRTYRATATWPGGVPETVTREAPIQSGAASTFEFQTVPLTTSLPSVVVTFEVEGQAP